jgi:hypothetical protein
VLFEQILITRPQHVDSKKHIKFAYNTTNFEALDYVLDRLKRQTMADAEARERLRLAKLKARYMAVQSTVNES